MRRKVAALGAVLAVGMLGAQSPAQAGQDCISYAITAPVAGSRSGTRCFPGLFTQPFSFGTCQAVPLLRVEVCVDATIYTP